MIIERNFPEGYNFVNQRLSPYALLATVLISQLCAGKSQFPITKRVEGAVLSSIADTDVNCTITFRTKSAQQHFVIRFEELKLGCDDHLKLFDGDLDYGQQSIKDFSCRDSLANAYIIKTTGTFLTMRFSSDSKSKAGDGFRLVVTAVYDLPALDCPPDYALCQNHLCISRSLFCDDVNHCVDNSDEARCDWSGRIAGTSAGSFFGGEISLWNALSLLLVIVLAIFTCVIMFITAAYCRRENPYAQYQHQVHRAMGVPMQMSSSLMFTNQQPQYHYFQPANLSPYITPQHHAALANALPRGYSTLPLNFARQQQQPQLAPAKGNNMNPNEYFMMTGLTRPPTATMPVAPSTEYFVDLPQ